MELQESAVNGGVVISHLLHEGKHKYEVKWVIENTSKEKFFLRRGDQLWQVNEADLQDVPPEDLAQILSQGNPRLTVHKKIHKKQAFDPSSLGPDILYPYSKEVVTLEFSEEMMKFEDTPDTSADNLTPEEDSIFTEGNDILVVAMKKTSISVITGRSCDPTEPCHECHNNKCVVNDIVMVTESSTVTRGTGSKGSDLFRYIMMNNACVEHRQTSMYIASLCSQKKVYVSENQERITIYYYKFAKDTPGSPVVLNFTGSDCFLRCSKDGDRVRLQVEISDKEKLKIISHNDPHVLSYLFYMKSDNDRLTTFESALHRGWFIRVKKNVEMVKTERPESDKFFMIIVENQSQNA